MEDDRIIYIVWGVLLLGIFLSILLAYRSRRLRAKRLLLMELFSGYFRGDMPADQVGQRVRQIASRHFTGSAEFFSLAIAAFQNAVDARTLASAALRGTAEETNGIVGGFKERVWPDRTLSD